MAPKRKLPQTVTAGERGKHADDLSRRRPVSGRGKGPRPGVDSGHRQEGRILKGDVLVAAEKPVHPSRSVPLVPSPSKGERTSRKKMSPLRQKIAARLLAAQQETAHLTTFNEVDLSNSIALRTKFQTGS